MSKLDKTHETPVNRTEREYEDKVVVNPVVIHGMYQPLSSNFLPSDRSNYAYRENRGSQ